jgi:hypothetical protein
MRVSSQTLPERTSAWALPVYIEYRGKMRRGLIRASRRSILLRRSGSFSLALGGVLAALLGFLGCAAPSDAPGAGWLPEPSTSEPPTPEPPPPELAADPLWDIDFPPTYRLTFPTDTWRDDLVAAVPRPDDECAPRPYLEASLEFDDPSTGETLRFEQVGVRYRGRSAIDDINEPDWDKRAGFKIAVDEYAGGGKLFGRGKINLLGTEGDRSQIREFLGLRLARQAGVPAPRTNYAHLFVNDEYQGIFPQSEEPDEREYLDLNFKRSDGPLFKVSGYCGGTVDFDYDGTDEEAMAEYLLDYEPKTGTSDEDLATYLVPLLACVQGAEGQVFDECIADHIDVEAWLRAIAVDIALPDYDGLVGGGKNFLLYRDPSIERFVVYPWDKDLAFDIEDLDPNSGLFGVRPDGSPYTNELVDQLLVLHRADYCEHMAAVADVMDPDVVVPFVQGRLEFLEPLMEADPFIEAGYWDEHVEEIMEGIEGWHSLLGPQLAACLAE